VTAGPTHEGEAQMPSAVTAVVFVALFAGHQIGDHIVQTNAAARAKGAPTRDMLAAGMPPWRGWGACLRHVGTYTLCQAVALVMIRIAEPVSWAGVASAVAVSASTHAVIDRRWLVRFLVRVKRCQDWPEALYLIDQSLHIGALLLAAVLAATAANLAGAATVGACAAVLVGAALMAERRLAADACDRSASTVKG
jgi:hypothetical protein